MRRVGLVWLFLLVTNSNQVMQKPADIFDSSEPDCLLMNPEVVRLLTLTQEEVHLNSFFDPDFLENLDNYETYELPDTEELAEQKNHNKDKEHDIHLHYSDSPRQCPICLKAISSLSNHILIHREIRPFICSLCPKGYYYMPGAQQHVQTKHKKQMHDAFVLLTVNGKIFQRFEIRKPRCGECKRVFNNFETFKRHVRAHK